MDSLVHFIKHSLGLCGCCPKTIMTMLMGGTSLMGVCGYYWNELMNGFKKMRRMKCLD